MTEVIYVYVTCRDIKEARKIAAHSVSKRLAACGNIFPNMESVYWWDNDVQSNNEVVLILKAQQKNYEAVEKAVKSLHSYECPCITVLPIQDGYQPYLDWVRTESSM